MLLGNRRFVVVAVLCALVAAALTGCSANATFASTNGEAVAIGQQALGFTASGGSSAGWTSPMSCPQSFENGLRSSLASTDTIEKLDPTTVSGPPSDPKLTKGYVATCVYRLTSATKSVVELAFFDIDDSHVTAVTSKLTSDGFASQGTTTNTLQGHPYAQTIYASSVARIVVEKLTINSIPALIVVG